MPTSSDPVKRQAQLANLRPGRGAPGGNRRAITHGAYAALPAERLDGKVRQVAHALGVDAPVRADDGGLPAADAVAVRQLAEALCRLEDIDAYLLRRGWEDDGGKPRPVLDYEGRLRSHVLDLLRELGMTPRSRAALGLDLVRASSAGDALTAHLAANYADADGTARADDGDTT